MRRLRSEVPALLPLDLADAVPSFEKGMNEEQLAVVRHVNGPLWNLAQAGSGKTSAAVNRVARLVRVEGVDPSRICMVTFSRKAADEMNSRLKKLGVVGVGQTWHSLAGRILREDGTIWSGWTVDEKNKFKQFLKAAVGYKHMDWKGADVTKLDRFIGTCKANLVAPSDPKAEEIARKSFGPFATRAVRAYAIAQELVEDARLLTFDDMLVYANRHLDDEANRLGWAGRFDYVIQDEAQDQNVAQMALGEKLARDHRNYQAVGDLAQSIYGFRGSSPEHLAAFPEAWGGAARVAMCKNYRCGKRIVAVANEIIRPAETRLPEDMIAMRDFEGTVRVVAAANLDDEAREVVGTAKGHIENGGDPADMCILFRTNAQSRALEDAFLAARVPYVLVGGVNFYERKEVKDLLAYARLAVGKDRDGDALKRSINAPFRFLGAKFVEKVEEEMRRDGEASAAEWVMRAANRERIQARQLDSAKEWIRLVLGLQERVAREDAAAEQAYLGGDDEIGADHVEAVRSAEESKSSREMRGAYEALNDLVRATGYIAWLEKEEGEESVESSHAANVRELLRVAQSFKTLRALVDYCDAQIDAARKSKKKGSGVASVTLMSIHRSKGLEWPIVWVVGMNENILPHAKGDEEEERRLAYVAATRARDTLVVSWVKEAATRSGMKQMDPSRFIDAFYDVDGVEFSYQGEKESPVQPADLELEPGFQPAFDEGEKVPESGPVHVTGTVEGEGTSRGPLAWLGSGATCAACGQTLGACDC